MASSISSGCARFRETENFGRGWHLRTETDSTSGLSRHVREDVQRADLGRSDDVFAGLVVERDADVTSPATVAHAGVRFLGGCQGANLRIA